MARMLHESFLSHGHDAWLLVGSKGLNVDPDRTLLTPRKPRYRGELGLRRIPEKLLGLQYFASPSLAGKSWPLQFKPDVLLIHSMHGSEGYFRLEDLKWLSMQCPTFLFLHDQWLMTGHCAYTLGCELWRTGCPKCPDISIYPAVSRDGCRYNWQRKRKVLRSNRLQIGAPARWLLDLARESPILRDLDQFYIPNAFDPRFFYPGDRDAARNSLGIPDHTNVILFLAQGGSRSPFKDFRTLAAAFAKLRGKGFPFRLITVGGRPDPETRSALPEDVTYFDYSTDRSRIADFYRAADVFCLSTRAEVLPLTILESLACGTPVVATDVGGVSEVVIPGKTGWLVPPADADVLANTLMEALSNSESLRHLRQSVIDFSGEFVIGKTTARFLELFRTRLARDEWIS